MATVAFDTHAAVRELRAGGFDEDQAERLVDVFSRAVGDPVTKADLEPLATKRDLESLATKQELEPLATKRELEPLATKSELAALEARLAWRLIGAGIAVAGIQAAAIVGLLRLVLTP